MAFGAIKETAKEVSSSKKYIGIMPVKVVALNPDKKWLEGYFGRDIEKEPEYLSEVEYEHPISKAVSKIKQVRLDFFLESGDPTLEFRTKVTFFLRNTPWISQAGKCQVIDKYGRTAWVTAEEYQDKKIPQYSNGPARISPDYTTAVRSQEELITFLKYYLGIPNVDRYVDGVWKEIDNVADAEASLKDFSKLFTGDVSEIRSVLDMAKNNLVKVLLGVRIVDGKQYQDVFNSAFLRNNSDNTKVFENALQGYTNPNTIYEVCSFKEFVEHSVSQPTVTAGDTSVDSALPF